MIYKRKLLQQYTFYSILPYFILALTLLSLALLAQQASRLVELTGEVPVLVIAKLTILLLPNIFIFSVPAASLLGVLIGLRKMGSDSELIVAHGAGISDLTIMRLPILAGTLLSITLFFTNFYLTPYSATQIRLTIAQAGLAKINSPIEPKIFYDGMPGKVIFVRDGDKTAGQWQRVFIHWQTSDHQVRIVTARTGRIDTSEQQSELVLSDAEVITLSGQHPRSSPATFDF